MASILVAYGSTTGNTATAADIIEELLSDAGHTVTVKDISEVKAEGICDDFDTVLFGCSTWGEEEIILQDDFEEFYENMDSINAPDNLFAVFGCGDVSYTYYCGAVDQIEEKLESLGADLITSGLKIDGDPNDAREEIAVWVDDIIRELE